MSVLQQGSGIEAQDVVPVVVDGAITVAIFVVAFVVIYALGKSFAARAVAEGLKRRGFNETLVGFAVNVTVVAVAVVAIALAATVAGFGVVLSAFAILSGALALAVGFATQDLIANFVAGAFILRDEPFEVGDWIEWDGHAGVVRDISLRVTTLDTFDNQILTVPNGDLANAALINNVANDRRRVAVEFGIGYADDIDQARAIILEEGAAIDGVLEEPAPAAPVTNLGDSAVILSGRIWIDPEETGYGGVRAQWLEAVKARFDAEGIDMPYSTTELSGGIEVRNVSASADD
ncbi:MAG: mechanosensitive ion channel family protein [Halobacteriales archaeon]